MVSLPCTPYPPPPQVKGLETDFMKETTVKTLVQVRLSVAGAAGLSGAAAPQVACMPRRRLRCPAGRAAAASHCAACPRAPCALHPQNIGKAVYKDKEQIIASLRKAYPPFKETKEFEFAFKIRWVPRARACVRVHMPGQPRARVRCRLHLPPLPHPPALSRPPARPPAATDPLSSLPCSDRSNPKDWYLPKNLIDIPEEVELEKTPVENVKVCGEGGLRRGVGVLAVVWQVGRAMGGCARLGSPLDCASQPAPARPPSGLLLQRLWWLWRQEAGVSAAQRSRAALPANASSRVFPSLPLAPLRRHIH